MSDRAGIAIDRGAARWLCLALVAGCSAPTTTRLAVNVSISTGVVPTTVTVTVFDAHGKVGSAAVSPAPLPGQLMLTGLPDRAVDLRVAAVGTGGAQRVLGATTATLVPHMLTTAALTLAYGTLDGDNDDVPDAIDDCPTVPDPDQLDAAGVPPGDACRGDALPSLVKDLGGANLSGSTADMVPSTADMMRPASTCGSATVALCDGFESAVLAPHWVVVNQTGGTVTVDPTRAYRGAASLHLHNDALGANASDVEIDETQAFAQHLYARAFVYVPAGFDQREADLVLVEQNANPYQGITLGLANGVFMTQNTLAGGGPMPSATPMPSNGWACVEWEVRLGSAVNHNGTTTLTVDGKPATGLGAAQPLYAAPAINQLGLALIGPAGTPARDVWIDELIVDTNPIGCAK